MSVIAYVGLPGSGKSYGVVENVIIPALKAGRHVITNIPLKCGYLSDDFPKGKITQFDSKEPLDNPEFWCPEKHAGAIWVIDEAWRYWPSGKKQSQFLEKELGFFAEHRHYVGSDGLTTEIVLVTQNLDQIANAIRNHVQETYLAKKLSALGLNKHFEVLIFDGAKKGLDGGTPLRAMQGKYKDSVFKYYKSHTKNKTDFAAGMEQKADKRNNIFKGKFFTLGIPIALFLIWMGVSNLMSYLGGGNEPKKSEPTPEQNDFRTSRVNPAMLAKSEKQNPKPLITRQQEIEELLSQDITREYIPLSETWRIVGQVGRTLLLWSEDGEREVPKHLCGRFSNTRDDYCVYNGEMVTWYSSTRPYYHDEERQYATPDVEEIF